MLIAVCTPQLIKFYKIKVAKTELLLAECGKRCFA